MLREVELTNFQIHKHLKIRLVPGVNVIIGETNQGKSSIIRGLAWLFHGRPLGAAKIWQTRGTNLPMSVTVTDTRGNKITRTPRTYVINGGQPLKAFGTSVPEQVTALFPLQPINWGRQFSDPFVITGSGGQAAKVIGKAAGADEQEEVMAGVKTMLASDRSEIKRQKTNQAEAQVTVSQLKDIPKLKFRATKLKFQIASKDHKLMQAESLAGIVDTLADYDRLLAEGDPAPRLSELQGIERLIENQKQNQTRHQTLRGIITRLNSLGDTDTTFLHDALTLIQDISDGRASIDASQARGAEIAKVVLRLNALGSEIPRAEADHQRAQQEFDAALIEAGVCPFCNQQVGGSHAAC